MTIITKSGDKKQLIPLPIPRVESPNIHNEEAAIMEHRSRTNKTNCLVFMMALLVLMMGVLSGVCVYRQYLREKFQKLSCYIPYDSTDADQTETFWMNSPSGWRDGPTDDYRFNENYNSIDGTENEHIRRFLREIFQQLQQNQDEFFNEATKVRELEALNGDAIARKFFKEDVEISDDDSDSFADITIPDFKDGRSGRFIHDFVNNLTTIVDMSSKRCFVYPLDRETVLMPKSLAEVMMKMQQNAYFPDTNVLRQKMRVVIPPLDEDDEMISPRTAKVCEGNRIYKLEPFVSGVYKRSIGDKLTSDGMFAEFAGVGIINVDLLNIKEVEEFEKV